jgi:hypothetical protein
MPGGKREVLAEENTAAMNLDKAECSKVVGAAAAENQREELPRDLHLK